jgi:16S rRNA (cytidine1402-2'-O)-methyltransferase
LPGTLYIVATPIGNLEDITLRALRVLREEAAVIACEDTRQTLKLLDHYGIRKPLVSYHEHNETSRTGDLLKRLREGENVALVSDAGTPLISDPGYRIVKAAVDEKIAVVSLPGASAILTALAASGLPAGTFRFAGFLPPKSGARRRFLESTADEDESLIVYESPHRILEALTDLAELFPTRPVVVARELTKIHEEFLRGTAAEVHTILASRATVKGEFTIVMGRTPDERTGEIDVKAEVSRLEREENLERMEAIKAVAKRSGLPKREVYRLLEAEDSK